MRKFTPGQKVTFNGGFHGVVVRYLPYTERMIEVRGSDGRGSVAINEADAEPAGER